MCLSRTAYQTDATLLYFLYFSFLFKKEIEGMGIWVVRDMERT